MLPFEDVGEANTIVSADIRKSKNHVITGSAMKGLNMKVDIPVVL